MSTSRMNAIVCLIGQQQGGHYGKAGKASGIRDPEEYSHKENQGS